MISPGGQLVLWRLRVYNGFRKLCKGASPHDPKGNRPSCRKRTKAGISGAVCSLTYQKPLELLIATRLPPSVPMPG